MNDDARELRIQLVRQLDLEQRWRAVFEHVPRHVFVPRIIGCWPPDPTAPSGRFHLDSETDPKHWLELVYSDRLLIIVDDGERVSSSSMPSAMAHFLQLLDVRDEDTVLEIGTGSGYNAALLCEKLGAERVTTIDTDFELVAAARSALANCGYRPIVAVADGYFGFPSRAPYDRIVATCSVQRIPNAWCDQLRPNGVVVAPMKNGLLVALRQQADGSLVGRAGSASFMPLRSPALPEPAFAPFADGDVQIRPLMNPGAFDPEPSSSFYAQLQIPDLALAGDLEERALAGRADGSWARVVPGEEGGHIVVQAGPRRLWNLYEAAIEEWTEFGRPGMERYGMTITPDRRQYVWLDFPESEHIWEL